MAESAQVTTAKPKVTLHWLNTSRSQRIVWLLEQCQGVDFDIEVYKRLPTKLAPPELKKIHPLGKSPVITIDAGRGGAPLTLAESGTICEYLVQYFAPQLAPKQYKAGQEGQIGGETEQWMRYRFFMHYVEGTLMTVMLIALFMDQIKEQSPWIAKPITGEIVRRVYSQFLTAEFDTQFSFLESQLATSPEGGRYLCGKELTAADIMMSYAVIAGRSKIVGGKYPKLTAYIDLLENDAGYKHSADTIEKVTGEKFEGAIPR